MSHNPYIVSKGIILYSRMPLERTMIVFDSLAGKIDCVIHGKHVVPLAHGTLIEYTAHQKRDFFRVSFLEPIAVPAEWVRDDIYFLHHVLELCSVYTPWHQTSQDVFSLLAILYMPCASSVTLRFFKKLFLCRLHTLLGMYPDEEVHDPELLSLISCAGDSMFDLQDDTEIEGKLTMWLYRSLCASNAQVSLKTFSFVKRLDIFYEEA